MGVFGKSASSPFNRRMSLRGVTPVESPSSPDWGVYFLISTTRCDI